MTTPEPDIEAVLALAAIIREVHDSYTLGADALAKAILSHPCSRWQAAAPPDRDASIKAAWGILAPADAVEGLRRLAGDLKEDQA